MATMPGNGIEMTNAVTDLSEASHPGPSHNLRRPAMMTRRRAKDRGRNSSPERGADRALAADGNRWSYRMQPPRRAAAVSRPARIWVRRRSDLCPQRPGPEADEHAGKSPGDDRGRHGQGP